MQSSLRLLVALGSFWLMTACSTPVKSPVRTPATTAENTPVAVTAPVGVGPFVSDIRQLTFAGRRAGEGYFSRDGQTMIFQSERQQDNPFYQIYLMNLASGKTWRVSPGVGKSTCSWIHPDGKHVLFASTHADPKVKDKTTEEWEARQNPKGKYAWSFDDTYDIYQADLDGKNLRNLTHSPGYDAEGSYSPDGKWIAFASNRAAYTEPMTDEQKKLFARDPSSMMDIYIMRADGRDVKRLTSAPGYDGGPFFSPDGKRLTFRRFSVDGGTAEVYTIGVDGRDERQITHMKAMSWAPFYHPSGDYLIFASNKMGYSNFELYIVDTEGKQEPQRVTDLPGFDGLPVFTPDGHSLVWTHGNDRGEAQLHRAHWNDTLARQVLGLKLLAPQMKMASGQNPKEARAWVEYLASDEFAGRATGGIHEDEYLGAIAEAFKALGLKPVGTSGQYLQPYEFTAGVEIDGDNGLQLKINNKSLFVKAGADYIPLSFSQTGHFAEAPLVFAGYGIVAPANGGQPAYDSFAGLDVKDKWAVVFSGMPEDVSNERRFHLHQYTQLEFKALMARQRGAMGLLVVDDTVAPPAPLHLNFEGRSEDAGLPVLRISQNLANEIFAANKTSRSEWTTKLSHGDVAGASFAAVHAQADVGLKLKKSETHNVLAELKVPGATSTLVIGAHGDHLGRGEMGNSLWRGEKNRIHSGADDNASGVAGVLEIARKISEQVAHGKLKLKQNVVFAVWSGEEIGILGSTHFAKDMTGLKVSAYLNMDMIGRYRDLLLVQGTGSAAEWNDLIESSVLRSALAVRTQEDPYLPTDSLAFYLKQIPTLTFFTGSHPQYHTPDDKAELLNYEGLVKTAELVEGIATRLAANPKSLVTYRKVEAGKKQGEGRGFRLYLGTIPDYSQEGKTGVAIAGTSKDSPAEKAGIKAGDRIVELGGMKIQNLYDFVYCLQALKANAPIPGKMLRAGQLRDFEITPVLKTQQ